MTSESSQESVPRRDFILLPFISFLTVVLMTASAEFLSRRIWVEKSWDECGYNNPILGLRHKPNCVMTLKNVEGPWVRYQMNECGYRGTVSCGQKPQGTLRVVIIGSSVAYGLDVPYDEYFANRVAPELSRIWGHPVEFQNLGDADPTWAKSDLVLKEVLSLEPDAVIYMIMPFDLRHIDHAESLQSQDSGAPRANKTSWTLSKARTAARESRLLFITQHFLLQDANFLVRTFENYASPLDVSRQPTPPLVEQRFERLDVLLGSFADRIHETGIPSFMLALPNNVQAALICRNLQVPHMDALTFVRRMREIAQRHGIEYIDLVPELRKTPNAEKMFYPVDGHPNGGAHALLAKVMVEYFRHRSVLPGARPVALKQ